MFFIAAVIRVSHPLRDGTDRTSSKVGVSFCRAGLPVTEDFAAHEGRVLARDWRPEGAIHNSAMWISRRNPERRVLALTGCAGLSVNTSVAGG